jgi:hypothetical protein
MEDWRTGRKQNKMKKENEIRGQRNRRWGKIEKTRMGK